MKPTKYAAVGRMDLKGQGYRLDWGPRGLVVHIIDYHAKPLGIPWSLLRDLANAAEQDSEERDPA